jgi:AcrR family transcriptional regulator
MSEPTAAGSTRDRILAAALAAFADRGVDATSLDSVAAEVGVRKQTLLYWFPSKEQLLVGVVDHAVAEVAGRLAAAAGRAGTRRSQVVAVVDAIFRLGTISPELLAVVREVVRLGPPASTHLAAAAGPLVDAAARSLGDATPEALERRRRVLLAAGAQVLGVVTEAELRTDLGLPPDLRWLRERRRAVLAALLDGLA